MYVYVRVLVGVRFCMGSIAFSVFMLDSELSGVCMHVGDQCVRVLCACVFLCTGIMLCVRCDCVFLSSIFSLINVNSIKFSRF